MAAAFHGVDPVMVRGGIIEILTQQLAPRGQQPGFDIVGIALDQRLHLFRERVAASSPSLSSDSAYARI